MQIILPKILFTIDILLFDMFVQIIKLEFADKISLIFVTSTIFKSRIMPLYFNFFVLAKSSEDFFFRFFKHKSYIIIIYIMMCGNIVPQKKGKNKTKNSIRHLE